MKTVSRIFEKKSDKGFAKELLIAAVVALALLVAAYAIAAQTEQPQQPLQCEFTHYGNRIFWVLGPQTPVTVPFVVQLEKSETQMDAYMRVLRSVFNPDVNFARTYGFEKAFDKAAEEYKQTLVSLLHPLDVGGLRKNIAIACQINEGVDEPIKLRVQFRLFVTRY